MASQKKSEIAKFISKARSILWSMDTGPAPERKAYNEFEAAVVRLMKRHEWSRHQATVQVAKDYKQLKDLFVLYDVKNLDPAPGVQGGKWDAHSTDKEKAAAKVKCLGEETPYREQLRWALQTAGEFASHEKEPATCPCWGAYYLYIQARENPKEFMAKLGQAESKVDADAERSAGTKKSSKRSVEEINEMLDELLNDEPEKEEEE